MFMTRPTLLNQMRTEIRRCNYSRRTEECYVGWVKRFVRYHHMRHPRKMGQEELVAFLSYLATRRKVSPSTQNQAASAILFLYRHVLKIDLETPDGFQRARRPNGSLHARVSGDRGGSVPARRPSRSGAGPPGPAPRTAPIDSRGQRTGVHGPGAG